jgi:threonine/homoserine/homoserine lactone efflux protein
MLLPLAIILLRVNYGCAGIEQTDASIKTILIVFSILFLALNFRYYSSSRTRRLRERFSEKPSIIVWIKTLFAVLLIISFLVFTDDFLRIFMVIPEC